jgi:molybdenum cofactor synthesis domain-containing protein
MVEHTQEAMPGTIEVVRPAAPGDGVVRADEDAAAGAELVPAGRPLRPQDLGLLAAAGVTELEVHARPRVAIVSTGDEVVDPATAALAAGQVRDACAVALAALVREAGGEPDPRGIVPDDRDALAAVLGDAVASCDVVVVSAGSSVGARDETAAVVAALAVGTAYSVPPARLKRYPVVASMCVSGVRSAIVNLGVAAHFSAALSSGPAIPDAVWALTLFVLPFSLAIAILKDVPDAEGDRRHQIATFTVRHGGRTVMRAGLAVLTCAYVGMALLGPLLVDGAQPVVLAAGHLAALALLWLAARGVDPSDHAGFTRFYLRVWQLFFLEYAVVPLSCLAS